MFDFIIKPLAWLGVFFLCLIGWWFILRLLFKAYYFSRLEFYQELKKRMKKDGGNDGSI